MKVVGVRMVDVVAALRRRGVVRDMVRFILPSSGVK